MPEDRDALVEKVARALRSVDIEAVPEGILTQAEREDFYRKAARAAIASILPPTTSAGDGELVELRKAAQRAIQMLQAMGDTEEGVTMAVRELAEALK